MKQKKRETRKERPKALSEGGRAGERGGKERERERQKDVKVNQHMNKSTYIYIYVEYITSVSIVLHYIT